MSESTVVRWDDWSGGDQGLLSAFEAGRRVPRRYAAENLLFDSRTGRLVPRKGASLLKTTAHTGETCVGMGFHGTLGAELWYALRNDGTGQVRIVLLDVAAATETDLGTLGVLAANEQVAAVETADSRTYLTIPGVGLYFIDHVLETISAVTGPTALGGHAIAVYGDRLYVGGVSSTEPNRVYFSDALDFETFGALSWFDVGHGPEVRFLAEQRGHLTIALQDGTWWVLNGLANSGGVLRRVAGGASHPWHLYGNSCVVLGDDRIAFAPVHGDAPALFDGSRIVLDTERSIDLSDYPDAATSQTRYVAVRGVDPDEVVFRSGLDPAYVLVNRRGAWTRQRFGFTLGGPHMASDGQGTIYLGGLSGTTFAVYRWSFAELGIPNVASGDTIVDAGAAGQPAAFVSLPEWWHPDGNDVMVRSVTVEYVILDQGDGDGLARLSCQVDAINLGTSTGVTSSTIQSAVIERQPDPAGTSTLNGEQSFHVGEQGAGRGFRIHLSDIEGVAIQRVTAHLRVDPPRVGR